MREQTALERMFLAWKEPERPPSGRLVLGAVIAAVVGSVAVVPALRAERFGVGLLLTAITLACVAGVSLREAGRLVQPKRSGFARVNRTGLAFGLLALLLVSVAAVRDAEWVVGLAVVLAVPIASYALAGGRTWVEVIGGGLALPPAGIRMASWSARGLQGLIVPGRGRAWPVIRTALIAGALLSVFGGLFAMADAAFGDLAAGLVPDLSIGSVLLYVVVGAATAAVAFAAVTLAQTPPPLKALAPQRPAPAGRWAWAVPIAMLDLLFLAFCTVQARVFLASDRDRVLRATGLTYAEYAREGFFQLVIVTVLVLAVLAFAVRYAPTAARGDRATVRVLLGTLCALTLVVVAVALRRLYLYEETFGWTRLRLWVHAFELWLGLVIVLVAAAGARWRAAWLPRAVAGSGAAAFIALAVLNPDGFIAERNVTRFEETGKIDGWYLGELSADAVPALDRLPEPQRSCALQPIQNRLREEDPAAAANLARQRAREILERRPAGTCSSW
ncbi:DUF4153 domain-containing protein [Spirillospora albida]|uniref:DUF4153 domain-containing protein n=1 Tax=Spirillospora albida TaxID=58123 RepID=UPI00068F10A4|nr:DUF4173 domain-containing protein [Spirillospora albida]